MCSSETVSIIIPVFEEAPTIFSCMLHLESVCRYETAECIFVCAHSDRETADCIRLRGVEPLMSGKGRAFQMNAGGRVARGDILLFLHADTCLPPNALNECRRALDHGQCPAGAFDLRFRSHHPALKLIAKAASLRSRITRIPYGDQAIFMKREYFNRIGGYADVPIMEDVEIMRRIKKRGDRITILSAAVYTSARRWLHEGIIYTTLRNNLLLLLYYAGVKPQRLVRYYNRAGIHH